MEGSSQNGPGGVNGSQMNSMSRAERFEDEKKRIIETCFAKKDEDGSLLESYITHIRIIEDAAFPSTPPPPNSNPGTKKPRLIIVAVRKSGRVRMHKARENANGSFSIGKTWMLDDLTGVKSFNGVVPMTTEEENHKQWARGEGFVVNIGKPYYWQANTQKEKQFFIASLVKIYTKYTGGKSPNLDGFETRERDQLLGVSAAARPVPPSLQPAGPPPSRPSYGAPPPQNRPPRRDPSQERALRSSASREAMQRPSPGSIPPLPPSGGSSFTSQTSRPQMRNRPEESPVSSMEVVPPPMRGGPSPMQSPPALRRLANDNQSQEYFGRTEDISGPPPRSRGGQNGVPPGPGRFGDRSMTPNSLRTGTPDSTVSSIRDVASEVPPVPAPLALPPERRRPPIPSVTDPPRQRGQNPMDNIIPAPLASPGMRRDDLRIPTRNSERSQPREREFDSLSTSPQPDMNGAMTMRTDAPRKSSESAARTESLKSSNSIPTLASAQSSITPLAVQEPKEPEIPEVPAIPLPPEPEEPDEEVRPGLGPMIKKKSKGDIAGSFMKAAKAANSFKPRAGGAAERLREMAAKQTDGPDGITEVVPAPSLVRGMSSDSTNMPAAAVSSPGKVSPARVSPRKKNESIPEVKISVPLSERPTSVEGPVPPPKDMAVAEKPKGREPRRPKPVSETMQKELNSLGIDTSILGGKGTDLVELWEQFGWVGEGIRSKNIDQMQEEIDRELNKVQAGGWLTRLDEEDERIQGIKSGLDKCIEECEELDGLLTLYSVELSTLNEDIAYIEAQSQGLQVQTANQRLLQAELKSLLDTISISSEQLGSLREASLESGRGLGQIESSLVTLFKAMLTIDPALGSSGLRPSEDGSLSLGKAGGFSGSELGSMRVLQEKKEVYKGESVMFLRRLKPFLQVKFGAAIDETRKALERESGGGLTRAAGKAKLDPRNHDLAREVLWRYSPLVLFSREVDKPEWEDLIKSYEMICKPLYQDEFRDAVFAWKRICRKPTGDEADLLFTSQVEKQTEGIATTARKLTVKRSQTLAKSLRSPIGDNSSKITLDKSDGRLQPHEVFAGALDEMVPIMSMEQNFIVEFFHVSSLEQYDFPDVVAASPPERRRGGDLKRPRVMDPDRNLAQLVVSTMEEIYSFFGTDMQSLVDWSVQADPLQGVGVIASVERKIVEFEESSQEYLARTLQRVHTKLTVLFSKFLDEQIRAIEDTKVKIKKRKGVIAFIRIFPSFSLSLETMLKSAGDLEIRQTVNSAYHRINRAMFESLKVIARENPGAQTTGADPEDKEALNYQILLIENMNHYLEEVAPRTNPVLEEWKEKAAQEMDEHLSLYLGAVIRRPLGKLLDFLESTESLMLSRQPGESAAKISSMPSHSKTTFKKVLASYDAKEIRRGIETLKKRVEKHFGDADDPALSRGLVSKVIQNCEKFYEKVEDRILTISRDVYDGDVMVEWSKNDVSGAFRK
ncbi:exocyst complex component Sec3-domain-containing protein [Amylocarpus encephaloides]|uniref:Exocyst complex component Sec3-domain-containing protein n=1 Tax=Amylocarpus encephaloides TaxID=45428 RepID=A0A9P7YMT7_9HELO|nr:exocyst complex component Sec3-domain-containing protein [Amylocarpus encephaloides]